MMPEDQYPEPSNERPDWAGDPPPAFSAEVQHFIDTIEATLTTCRATELRLEADGGITLRRHEALLYTLGLRYDALVTLLALTDPAAELLTQPDLRRVVQRRR